MDIDLTMEEEDIKGTETLLKTYYEGFIDMNNPKYYTTKKTVE